MAGSAVVGALRVTLGLDSAQFSAGMKEAQTGLQRFAGIAKTGALAIAGAMVAAGGAMALAMKGIIDDADDMYKLAQSIGVPIEELSRLRYAAELSGVEIESLGKAVKRLSAGMLDATESATGPAARAFAMLGIQIKDATGKMRPASAVVEDLATRFAQMPNGVAKTALAMRIFGKSGADMIPMLNAGGDGLRQMYAEAEQLGIVLDAETGAAAERFNDNLTRLGKVKDGIVTKITAGMLPALEDLSAGLVVAAKDNNLLRAVGGALGWTLKALMSVVLALGGTFYALAGSIGIAAIAAYKWAQGDFAGAAASIVTHGARIQATLNSLEAIHQGLWAGGSGPAVVVEELQDVETAANSTRRSVARLTDAQREAQRAAEELARAGQQTFDQTRTPLEEYTARVVELRRQLAGAAIDQDTFNRALLEAKVALEAATQDRDVKITPKTDPWKERQAELAADMRMDLRDATYDGIRGGLEAAADGDLGQYLAQRIRAALMDNLATVLTDAITGNGRKGSGGNGGGWFAAAMSFFSGGSGSSGPPKLPGFKTGGSFKVGGSGGADSQLMQFSATPGEMVDIRKPGQDKGGGAPVHFDLRGAVMTSDLLQQMEGMAMATGGAAFSGARQQVPADMARASRYSLGRRS